MNRAALEAFNSRMQKARCAFEREFAAALAELSREDRAWVLKLVQNNPEAIHEGALTATEDMIARLDAS